MKLLDMLDDKNAKILGNMIANTAYFEHIKITQKDVDFVWNVMWHDPAAAIY